jgi:hypothetical protein
MLHLSIDRLAALGDEHPTPAEAAHLATCDECARERDAYVALVAMAHAERAPLGLPLTRWDAVAAALEMDATMVGTSPRHVRRMPGWPLRVAAGLLLMAGGAMIGRASAGAGLLPTTITGFATISASPDDPSFTSIEEARVAQRRSEQLYQQAVAYLAQYDSTAIDDGSPLAYKSRLAVFDRVISVASEAMREAPHDPVINSYYLTTLNQREATIRQLNSSLPASRRLNSF